MTEEELNNNLGTIARSGKAVFYAQFASTNRLLLPRF
jgi:HSP90 family molecular chaperone